jgi:hypothetical protein
MPKQGWYSRELAEGSLKHAGAVELASGRSRYADVEPGISVRQGMDRLNWELFRPGDHIPRRKNEVLAVGDNVYRYNGLVKFVIDMMADFVVQGIEVYHRTPSKERRYRHWWRKVKGKRVSERIANLAYRHGVACVKRGWANLAPEDVRDLDRAVAAAAGGGGDGPGPAIDPDGDVAYPRAAPARPGRIPMRYTFLNPMTVEVIGGELAIFGQSSTSPVQYGMRIPNGLIRAIQNATGDSERQLVANLPNYLTSAQLGGPRLYPIAADRIEVLHYKKDDWQLWADPLILSVLKDLLLYERMKDADRAALDGSISKIRLWKLGLPEHQIQPGPAAFRRLRDQLLAASNGGSVDLIWDAAIGLQESNSEVWRFLGMAKYEPVLQAIFCGLGIPQSIGGDAGGSPKYALSLKTLIERLQYVRDLVVDFWQGEFAKLQRAFGDRHAAELRFDLMTLSDEAAEQAIWLQLFDRDILSLRSIQEKFGQLPDVEQRRIAREAKLRDKGVLPYKTGPFTEAAPHPVGLAKAALQQGTLSPTEAGAPVKPRKKGDASLLDKQAKLQKDMAALKPAATPGAPPKKTRKGPAVPGPGRPRQSKDTAPRKKPPAKAAAGALAVQAWARRAQRRIAEVAAPAFLAEVGKANFRQVSKAQAEAFEARKFGLLCALTPGRLPDEESLLAAWSAAPAAPPEALDAYGKLARIELGAGVAPSADESRMLQASAYVLINSEATDGPADA